MEITEITFDEFWSAYPRKTGGKDKAKVKFNSLSEVNQFNAIQGAKHHAANNPQWKNPSLIPHATTFLNQKRWEDDIVEDKPATARVQESQNESQAHTVWSAMTQMYGSIWVSKYGEKPNAVWTSQLRHIGNDRIKRGLRRTLESKSEFPPSLPTFVSYCALNFGEECELMHKALSAPVTSESMTSEEAFAQLRGILK